MKLLARSRDFEKMADFQGDEIVMELKGFELSTETVKKVAEN